MFFTRINGKRRFIILVLIVCVNFSLFAADPWGTAGMKPTRMVTYKTIGDMKLKLHVFEPQEKSDTPRAAVLFFFGGGWNGGTPEQFYHQCRYLAKQGMVAMSAEYRTKNNGKVEPPECVKDGKAAVRYVRQHAK